MVRPLAKPRFIASLKRRWLADRKRRIAGFTLLELLVSMLIGAIITVLLLGLVIELTEANQKDVARNETQRDMQAALDYISQDLREAVFVYDGKCFTQQGTLTADTFGSFCPGLLNHVPASLSNANTVPVLAFWRTDALPETLQTVCRGQPDRAGVPCLANRTYTLVIYAIRKRSAGEVWSGKARLLRYELPQFNSTAGTANAGYVIPLRTATAKFLQWPYEIDPASNLPENRQQLGETNPNGGRALAAGLPSNDADVLVDFVDDVAIGSGGADSPACRDSNNFPEDPNDATTTRERVRISPPDGASFNSGNLRGFYACIRGQLYYSNVGNDKAPRDDTTNQEVQLVLVGNVAGRSGFPLDLPRNSSRLFPLQTRVLTRGAVDKTPLQ